MQMPDRDVQFKQAAVMDWIVGVGIGVFCCIAPFVAFDSRDGQDWSSGKPWLIDPMGDLVGNRQTARSRLKTRGQRTDDRSNEHQSRKLLGRDEQKRLRWSSADHEWIRTKATSHSIRQRRLR
jgi:hypothetical protein